MRFYINVNENNNKSTLYIAESNAPHCVLHRNRTFESNAACFECFESYFSSWIMRDWRLNIQSIRLMIVCKM